jgi:hypothetical protein
MGAITLRDAGKVFTAVVARSTQQRVSTVSTLRETLADLVASGDLARETRAHETQYTAAQEVA